jgi:FtsP/CotA-like multicopper oxidase with cupredoxin domain
MRSNLGTPQLGCSFTDTVSPEALAGFFYENTAGIADTTVVPTTNSTLTDDQLTDCGNDDLSITTAFCVQAVGTPAITQDIEMVFGSNGTNFVWTMNNSTFRGDYNDPTLEHVAGGNMTFEPEWNVFNFGNSSSIRIVLTNTFSHGPHPMHLHGHNFHVLSEGTGAWDGTVVNAGNSQVRDVQILRSAPDDTTPSHLVIQWQNDNPGVWPLHCHIAWHVSAGLYINVLEQPEAIQAKTFPASIAQNTANWAAWTNSNVVDQIDSGV